MQVPILPLPSFLGATLKYDEWVSIDTETALIQPGKLAPPMTCLSYYENSSNKGLLDHIEGPKFVHEVLDDPYKGIVGQNIAFDLAVLIEEDPTLEKKIYKAYEADRIQDTRLLAKLWDIQAGKTMGKRYSLAALAKRFLQKEMDKHTWRTGYGPLRGTPIDQWQPGARDYALEDAEVTLDVFHACGGWHPNGAAQARAAWALHKMSMHGARTDQEAVKALELRYRTEYDSLQRRLLKVGFLKVGGTKKEPKVQRDLKAIREAVTRIYGHKAPMTAGGAVRGPQISTSRETLEGVKSHILTHKAQLPISIAFYREALLLSKVARYVSVEKMLSTYVRALKPIINPRYNPLVDTGRTSCGGTKKTEKSPSSYSVNVQNLPRDPGVRECFVPRPGTVYCGADYDTLELRALGHICKVYFKHSRLADTLNKGKDPHTMMAAHILGVSYDQALAAIKAKDPAAKKARSFAKIANFGFPGGLGAATLVKFARGWGVSLSEQEARNLKHIWRRAWPEMNKYFEFISRQMRGDRGNFVLPGSERMRGNIFFTEACNYFFQGTAADGAKEALWQVVKECYTMTTSPLYGSRPIFFIHDEIIIESPEAKADKAAKRLAKVMCSAMQKHIPTVTITSEPFMMRRWYKDAEAVFNKEGKLIPWEPK